MLMISRLNNLIILKNRLHWLAEVATSTQACSEEVTHTWTEEMRKVAK